MTFGDRRRADALQRALEAYERAVAEGTSPADAAAEAKAGLGPDASLFSISTGLPDRAAAAAPSARWARSFADQLRSTEIVPEPIPLAPRRRLAAAPLSIAATILVAASLLVPAMRSLPGDPLYALKTASEDTRVWLSSGPSEARVRLDLADERFAEVERLVDRAEVSAIGTGTYALSVDDIKDGKLAALIESTLREASLQLDAAADIMIAQPTVSAEDLDDLVAISKHGHALASKVADDLPVVSKPPVLKTAVKLAGIEAKAKAARAKTSKVALGPCDEPTPTPTATTDDEEAASSTAVQESPEVEPTATPKPTPCITPKPTPTPDPTPTVDPDASPTSSPEEDEGVEAAGGGEDGGMQDDGTGSGEAEQDRAQA
jgi:hypothetical protein